MCSSLYKSENIYIIHTVVDRVPIIALKCLIITFDFGLWLGSGMNTLGWVSGTRFCSFSG